MVENGSGNGTLLCLSSIVFAQLHNFSRGGTHPDLIQLIVGSSFSSPLATTTSCSELRSLNTACCINIFFDLQMKLDGCEMGQK